MEITELESLEQKTHAIVQTLAGLEREVEDYQDKNLQINEAFVGIANLSQKITTVSEDFLTVIELLKRSDLGTALSELDAKIKTIENLNQHTEKIIVDLSEKQDQAIKALEESRSTNSNSLSSIQEMLSGFSEKIGRIDRNTQKVFGKERA